MKTLKGILAVFALLSIAVTSRGQGPQATSNQSVNTQSTVPQAIKYQAIARNSNGDVIANQNVSFRISILQGSAQGNAVYQETQQATTNQFGLANLAIGQGSVVSGTFNSIEWGNDAYFVKIEFDPTGGSNFAVMGTSQLLAVPYSLYAAHAKVADNMPVFPLKAALQATNLQVPFDEPETGLLVYNTDSAGIPPYNVIPGYYYNAGTATDPNWVSLGLGGTNHIQHFMPCVLTSNTSYGGGWQDNCPPANQTGGLGTGLYNSGFGTSVFGPAANLINGDCNSAFGANGMFGITTGSFNTSVGDSALYTNQQGYGNTAVGYAALTTNNPNAGVGGLYNTAVGYESMFSNTTGIFNTAEGQNSLYSNTSGISNTSVGREALYKNLTGNFNTAVGDSALVLNTVGANNTACGYAALAQTGNSTATVTDNTGVGYKALFSNVSGEGNTATGNVALYNNTGSFNCAFGDSALVSNTTGNKNVAVGFNTLTANTSGYGNVAVGNAAGKLITTGKYNTDLGSSTEGNNSTGSFNTAVGRIALLRNTASYNVAVGDSSLVLNSTGTFNTAVGTGTMLAVTTASSCTAVGHLALMNNTGSWNTALGDSAGVTNAGGTLNTLVGYKADILCTASTNATSIGAKSQVGASNWVQLGSTAVVAVMSSGNNINYNPNITSYNATNTIATAAVIQGYITSSVNGAITLTLPTAANLATALQGCVTPALAQGTSLCFTIDNSASTGAGVVTLAIGANIQVIPTVVITGSGTLTVQPGSIGIFKLVYYSATKAILIRIS